MIFIESLESKQHCAALFIDLSKAFNTVDRAILKQALISIQSLSCDIKPFQNTISGLKSRRFNML